MTIVLVIRAFDQDVEAPVYIGCGDIKYAEAVGLVATIITMHDHWRTKVVEASAARIKLHCDLLFETSIKHSCPSPVEDIGRTAYEYDLEDKGNGRGAFARIQDLAQTFATAYPSLRGANTHLGGP